MADIMKKRVRIATVKEQDAFPRDDMLQLTAKEIIKMMYGVQLSQETEHLILIKVKAAEIERLTNSVFTS